MKAEENLTSETNISTNKIIFYLYLRFSRVPFLRLLLIEAKVFGIFIVN